MIDQGAKPPALQISAALQRILASPEFASSVRISRFLRHVVEQTLAGRAAELKESLIGVEVFDRPLGYDPKYDAIVRVEARRLRTKLMEYYAAGGIDDPIRVVLPKGSYVPEFAYAPVPEPAAPAVVIAAAPVPATARHRLSSRWAVVGLCLLGPLLYAILKPSPVEYEGITPFTSLPGYERKPAFSPDEAAIAFGWAGPNQKTTKIYVQRLNSENATPVTSGEGNDWAAAWSPDGATIAFCRERGSGRWDLMTVPAGGGPERKLAEIRARLTTELNLSWSRDGSYLLTAHRPDPAGNVALVRINAASGEISTVSGSESGDFFPDLSPDGKTLAFLHETGPDVADLMIAPWTKGSLDRSRSRRLSPERSAISGMDWMGDSRTLIYSSDRGGTAELWRINVDGSDPKLIPSAPSEALSPAVAPRSRRVAFVHRFRDINVWGVAPDGSNRRQITSSTAEDMSPDFSPDGSHIVFRSNRSGSMEIWTSARDGSHPVRLTHFQHAPVKEPRWSPDGQRIVFVASPGGRHSVYTVSTDGGGTPTRLFASTCNAAAPSWSRDGKWIYYASDCGGAQQILRHPADGGTEKSLTRNGGTAPVEHTDGFVYYFHSGERSGIWRVPRDGGTEEPVYSSMSNDLWGSWALAAGGLYHVRYGGITSPSVIQFFDFQSRRDRDVMEFAEQPVRWIPSMAVSPDGKEVLFSQLDRAGADIMLLNRVR